MKYQTQFWGLLIITNIFAAAHETELAIIWLIPASIVLIIDIIMFIKN